MKKSTAVFLLFALCLCAAGCSAQKTILTKNDESVIFIKDTQKEETTPDTGTNETSEASGTAQDQGKADGESSAEAPEPETSNDGSSDNASERSSQTEIFKPGTKKVSSALKEKYKFSDFSIIESVINNRFPDITQEQFDKMAEYMKITGVRDSPYELAVAAGLVDPDAPKMTLEKMREIIENAKNNKNLKNPDLHTGHKTAAIMHSKPMKNIKMTFTIFQNISEAKSVILGLFLMKQKRSNRILIITVTPMIGAIC